ncbi:MAG: hypothetical protein B5M52_03700 [Helicobacteraceae bacterium 4484_230]|nr:MAG: hypothetical protein B5M52_03700 [Helicobacteraceae bacterium 4484_230]
MKVLDGMFFGTIMLPAALASKLAFLGEYGVEFGKVLSAVGATLYTPVWLVFGFILTLLFKNSLQQINSLRISAFSVCFSAILFIAAVLSMNKISEFLYFNF